MNVLEEVPFSPDETVHVHEEGAIRLICAQFKSHEFGLPEWLKNSSDMYLRMDAAPENSVIIVLFSDGSRDKPSVIGCLDFGGMTTDDIEQKFRHWADPEAAGTTKAAMVEGGHGNGGKCYMSQMFESHSYLHTMTEGSACKYGFKGAVVPGYFPSASGGRWYAVADPDTELSAALGHFGLSLADLPEAAKHVWEGRKSFTLAVGFGAKHFARRGLPVEQWVKNLQGHQQMAQTIKRNHLYGFHNGSVIAHANPLRLPDIRPIPGAETPRVIDVPARLTDPGTGEQVETGAEQVTGRLVLHTSDVKMSWSLKARHTINGWAHENRTTGFWPIPELSRATYATKVYGDLYLNELENYKQNDRRRHTDSPLIRAITEWLTEQIDVYCAEFVKLDQLQATQEEKDELSRINEALDQWKNSFLAQEFGGIGAGGRGGTGGVDPPIRLPRGEPARVVLRLTHTLAGQGVVFRPSLEFFDEDGKRIRTVPFEWTSSDWNIATVDDNLNVITTHVPGKTDIAAVCKDSGLQSNTVGLEVLDILKIDLAPQEMELPMGSRAPISATVHTRDERTVDGVYLIWAESNDEIVSVGSGGMVFGLQPGTTSVLAGDDRAFTGKPTEVTVIEAVIGKTGGSGYPKILLSEIDDDPLGDVPPFFNSADPPVYQRPQDFDGNIWWINMASPLARRYIDTARGSGSRSEGWRLYHIERYIEIMVKILLTYDVAQGEELTFETIMQRWDEQASLMQTRVIESLQEFLNEGRLPGAA